MRPPVVAAPPKFPASLFSHPSVRVAPRTLVWHRNGTAAPGIRFHIAVRCDLPHIGGRLGLPELSAAIPINEKSKGDVNHASV